MSSIFFGQNNKVSSSGSTITTITIDQSISNPFSRVTGDIGIEGTPTNNVVSWIRANSHRYVGNYNSELGMVLKQLDDNDSTKYADGTDASVDITGANGGDVFMKMPTFWFRGELVSTNKYNILFSREEPVSGTWVKWDGNTLIGVYKAVCEDASNNSKGKLFSRSGITPTVNISLNQFKYKARNASDGDDHFMVVTYEAHKVMALLYIAYYGNTDGKSTIGSGTSSYPKVTGATNTDGMKDTVAENSRSINFWGLENWWGDIRECMDNLRTTGSSSSGNGCDVLDYSGATVRNLRSSNIGYVQEMILGEALDLLPALNSKKGNATTYYCCEGYVTDSPNRTSFRSGSGTVSGNGPFLIVVNELPTNIDSYEGSRLLYSGRVVIGSPSLLTINSIELDPVSEDNVPKVKTISGIKSLLTINGQNLDKLDNLITGLPDGIKISELSEGTTKRTAVISYGNEDDLNNLTLQLGGYKVQLIDPITNIVDLQYVIHNNKEVLRTGMDFHICDIKNFSNVGNIQLKGLNIKYQDIILNVEGTVGSGGNIRLVDIYDQMSVDIKYRDTILGSIKFHSTSEEDIIKEIDKEINSRINE